MDLVLYVRVLWRFRIVVAAGLALALVLGTLSVFNVGFNGVRPKLKARGTETWQSTAVVLLTKKGFPAGYIPGSGRVDPLSFASLAATYARLANGDEVRRLMAKHRAPRSGVLNAAPTLDFTGNRGDPLPMVTLAGVGPTAPVARAAASIGMRSFMQYVDDRQEAAGIPTTRRVLLQVVNAPSNPLRIEAPKKTLAIVVFMAILMATVALAFVLENLRPGIRLVAAGEPEPAPEARTDVRRLA